MDANKKITLQDIAGMAGVSRNTVSKILNGHYSGSPEVRDRVWKLMLEHNYKSIGQWKGVKQENENKTVILLCGGSPVHSSYFLYLVNEIQHNVESRGYVLLFYSVSQEDMEKKQLPPVVSEQHVDGIVCMEIFHKEFIEKLVDCQIPTVFLEFYHDLWSIDGKYDVVLMNNEYPVHTLTSRIIEQGCTNIGFVGDFTHCRGFYERYQGFLSALRERGITPNPRVCATFSDAEGYDRKGRLWNYLKKMDKLPDAFIVVNDSIAINLIQILEEWGLYVPQDVQIASFDDIPEAGMVHPPLTTVNSNRETLSKSVVECLLQRMASPDKPRSVVYVDSEIVYRGSLRQ